MIVPKEFFSLLPQPDWRLYPLAADPFAPVGMPEAAWHPPASAMSGLLESPRFNGTVNNTLSRIYRLAYDAAISYTGENRDLHRPSDPQTWPLHLTLGSATLDFGPWPVNRL